MSNNINHSVKLGTLNKNSDLLSASAYLDTSRITLSSTEQEQAQLIDLSVYKLSYDDYAQRVIAGSILSNELYVINDDYINAYGQQIKNLSVGTEISDAATVGQLCGVSNWVENNFLSSSASTEISSKSSIHLSSISSDNNNVIVVGGKLNNLNLYKFNSLNTYNLCNEIVGLSDIALIDEDQINAENERIISVADPVDGTDAANKRYVDGMLSGVSTNSVLSSFFNNIETNGINSVNLEQTMSAIYELIKVLR